MFTTIGKHSDRVIDDIVAKIVNPLNEAGYSGEIYVGYPIFHDPISNNEVKIDILIVSYSGVVIVNYLRDITIDYSELQDRLYAKINAKLGNYDFLIRKRNLFFDINQITFSENTIDKIEDYDVVFSADQLVDCIKKDFDDSFTEIEYSNIISGFQEAYGIGKRTNRPKIVVGTKSELVNNMEKVIERYDKHQMDAILTDPIGIQRIRGMAGSGKTVILARKAVELHTKHPEWDIIVTFNTRSLKNQIESLIDRFFQLKNNGSRPNYKKLRIINAWGASKNAGLYYDICSHLECDYYTFSEARNKFGPKNTFERVCAEILKSDKLPQKLYDCILIDEAQDFGPNFFKMCLGVLDHSKRLVYAYDELQNINEQTMRSPEELFGYHIQNDTPLVTTYRNQNSVIVSAHAIGMGLYSKTGLVQIPSTPDVWESIGYVSDSGIVKGHPVTLYRTKESSPDYLNAKAEELISVNKYENCDDMFTALAESIICDLETENLVNTDLMIIDMDTLDHEKNRIKFQAYLDETGLSEKFGTHLAGASSPEDFMRPDTFPPSIVYTSINRAKGNEAYQVYIINAQKSFNTLSVMRERNSLFTAITRSKGWVSILGYGFGMDDIITEINAVKENQFKLCFDRYPTDEEIKDLVKNNQDIAQKDQTTLDKAKRVIEDISKGKDNGDIKLKLAMELFGVSSYEELLGALRKNETDD